MRLRQSAVVGLASREDFDEHLKAAPSPVSWVLVKVGGLLTVNAHHGWDTGNRFIGCVADRLRSRVGPQDVLAHIESNEFAVLLADHRLDATEAFAAEARDLLSAPVDLGVADAVTRPVVTVVTTSAELRDPWSSAVTAHHDETNLATRRLIREALSEARSLQDLVKIAAEGGLDLFGADAIEVQLGAASCVAGTIPPGLTPGVLDIALGSEGLGQSRWWSSGEPDALPSAMLAMIADELAVAAYRHILEAEAETDPMTGLLNRRGLERWSATLASPYAVALVELDDTKRINDTFGHDVGDQALMALAKALGDGRDGEIAARWGGDEFVLVLPGASVPNAVGRLTRLLRELQEDTRFGPAGMSFSAGVAPGDGDLAGEIKQADDSMYEAKRAGKARVFAAGPAGPTVV